MKYFLLLMAVVSTSGLVWSYDGLTDARQDIALGLARRDSVVTQRDSLLQEVMETSRLVNDVGEALAAARTTTIEVGSGGDRGVPAGHADRAFILAELNVLTSRLHESEARLAERQRKAIAPTQSDSSLTRQLSEYARMVEEFKTTLERQKAEFTAIIEAQKLTIAGLQAELDSAKSELAQRPVGVPGNVEVARGFVRAGSRQELLAKGVVAEEGGLDLLFLGHPGRTLVPARGVDPGQFVPLSIPRDTLIPLPKSDRAYRIVSRHSAEYLALGANTGEYRGALHVTAPAEFWAASPYLILVEVAPANEKWK